MGDLVSDGTSFMCPFCTTKLKLTVTSSVAKGDSKNLANTDNGMFPPPPGGQCLVCPASPVPCTPSVTAVNPAQTVVSIEGKPAMGAGCMYACSKGGILTVSSPGQTVAQHS